MSQHIIGHCPVCKEKLVATRLTCRHCGLELSNDFMLNKFSFLSEEELEFAELFIHYGGNLKAIQKQLHLSYPAAKKHLTKVQEKLDLRQEPTSASVFEPVVHNLPVYEDETEAIKKIKEKLNAMGGIATLPLSKGSSFQIYYEDFGNGIHATNLPHSRVLTWSAFNCAVELLTKCQGQAVKGNAMKGKLGSAALPLDSVEGYVACHAYGAKTGDSCLRTISSLSAILAWADICVNGYGFLQLKTTASK